MGVMDSKLLQDWQIKELAQRIYKEFRLYERHRTRAQNLQPHYQGHEETGRNLNDLLAWQHFKVLEEMLSVENAPDGVLVDQFTTRKTLSRLFRAKEIDVNLVERPRSENDAAVAAASILARFNISAPWLR